MLSTLLLQDAAAAGTNPLAGLLLFLLAAFLYFLPAFLARRKRNGQAIFWLNLLAGWTGLGWLGALVWSLTGGDPQPAGAARRPAPQRSISEQMARLDQLRADGTITENDYARKQAQVLQNWNP